MNIEVTELHLRNGNHLSRENLGRLILSFNKNFHFYSLFVRFFVSLDAKDRYRIFVARSESCYDPRGEPPVEEDLDAMCEFCNGFAQGCKP